MVAELENFFERIRIDENLEICGVAIGNDAHHIAMQECTIEEFRKCACECECRE
ncbi:MAG: hypothetical protein FWB93_02475 [Oscillospiraceae bacterium]|nr:hypothetical protein [Oscillospiraceae bacterium]